MNEKLPTHYSNKLEINYNKHSAYLTDRVKLKAVLPGIIFGLMLAVLGLYEWLNAFGGSGGEITPVDTAVTYKPVLAVWFFDLCFILLGLGIFITNIFLFIRYNKYIIKDNSVIIIKRLIFRDKVILQENLDKYTGVRFRVEFMESGFLTQNRYIVELYNPNFEKIIPLYITKSSKNVRKKWKEYAKKFKLPAMIYTDEGLKKIELKNLNKSIAEQVKSGFIEDNYDTYEVLPSAVAFTRKSDKMVLKVRKIVWDVYNFVAWFSIFIISLTAIFVWFNIASFTGLLLSTLYILPFVAVLIVIVAIQILFRKEKMVIKKHKIVNTHKYMLFSTKHNEMLKKDIEAIEVTGNPVTGRYYVSIISDDNTITFGAKMAIQDLQWIKKFLVHEIIK